MSDDERQTYEVAVSMYDYLHIEARSREEARNRTRETAERAAPTSWLVNNTDVAGPFGGDD